MKWIGVSYVGASASGKTLIWSVYSMSDGREIGQVRWFGRWRKYAFFPGDATVFEEDCLRDIAQFIEEATTTQRESAKAKRE